jgi:hypothetical protein
MERDDMAKNRMTVEKHQRDAKKKRKAEDKLEARKRRKQQTPVERQFKQGQTDVDSIEVGTEPLSPSLPTDVEGRFN